MSSRNQLEQQKHRIPVHSASISSIQTLTSSTNNNRNNMNISVSSDLHSTHFNSGTKASLSPTTTVAVIGSGWYGREFTKRLVHHGFTTFLGTRSNTIHLIKNMSKDFSSPTTFTTTTTATTSSFNFNNFKKHRNQNQNQKQQQQQPQTPIQTAEDIIVPIETALSQSQIIILAIPSTAHVKFIQTYAGFLSGKVIVDVSNGKTGSESQSLAERLQDLVDTYVNNNNNTSNKNTSNNNTLTSDKPDWSITSTGTTTAVVKAFNSVSAYSLGNFSDSTGYTAPVKICSNSSDATRLITDLSRSIGYTNTIDMGSLRSARVLEASSYKFFNTWILPLGIFLGTYIFFLLWVIIRMQVTRPNWTYMFLQQALNMILGVVSLNLLGFTYLFGTLAQMWNLTFQFLSSLNSNSSTASNNNTSLRRPLPRFLISLLNTRKQLGLIALFLGSIHTILTMMILNPGSQGKFFDPVTTETPFPKLSTTGLIGLYLGTFSLFFMGILGLTSLPSVQSGLSWMEFRFIQSVMGWIVLAFGTAHVVVPAYKSFQNLRTRVEMPGLAVMACWVPLITVGLKVLVCLVGGVVGLVGLVRNRKGQGKKEYESVAGAASGRV
jgi:predicted dinucleotide-binding enzyme